MDFQEYVAARYGRLIEHAVLLGVADGEAGTHVDHVLLQQKKAIRKAADPDPLVYEALERSINGQPDRRSRAGPVLAIGLVLVAVAVAVGLTYRPAPEPMPSLFGLDGAQATTLLRERGLDVVLRQARACEPDGLVLGSEPPTGSLVRDGSTVTVRTAVPSGTFCDSQYPARSAAWDFIGFALGGPPPEFARTVRIVVDGSEPWALDRVAATDQDRWADLLTNLAATSRETARTRTGMPRLVVRMGTPPAETCGVPRPTGLGDRSALRLEIDPREDVDGPGCPLTIDLYREGGSVTGAIDGVVVYTGR